MKMFIKLAMTCYGSNKLSQLIPAFIQKEFSICTVRPRNKQSAVPALICAVPQCSMFFGEEIPDDVPLSRVRYCNQGFRSKWTAITT